MKGSLALLSKKSETEEQIKIITRMQVMVDEMEDLIESLLLLSREQNVNLQKQNLIVNDLIQPLVDTIQSTFEDKNIEVTWNPENLIEIEAAEQLLSIVLSNLIRNAFLYSPKSSQIDLRLIGSKIMISDQGPGMNEEQLANIMNPFYRVNDHSEVKGFGLGLAIVDWICKQCNWKVSFESQPGEGTTAILDLVDVKVLA